MALTSRFETPLRAAAALTAVAPLGASAGINLQITGTGFDPIASNNTVTLTPPTGAAVSLVGETIAVLDAAKGLRRIGITVPAGLPIGTAAVMVRNRTTNESASGRALQIVQISLPQTSSAVRGAQKIGVRIDGSANVQFVAGRTTPTFGAGVTVNSTQVLSPTSLLLTVSVSATTTLGPRTVNIVTSTQTMQRVAGFTVTAPNQPPAITSTPVTTASESQPYAYQVVATDPDGDPLTYRLVTFPAGMTIAGNLISWAPQGSQAGAHAIVIEAMDGRGGTNQQSFQITVAAAPQLQSIDVQPALLRFSQVDATLPLTVTGLRTNGTTLDLTPAASGTTYESSNTFVARVAPNGVVTSVANGSATITARNGSLTDTAAAVVELGVTLDSLELTPGASTLRSPGATQALAVRGRFSDGSTRDLTAAAGTSYESSNPAVASVAASGLVTAVANGQIAVTARHDGKSAGAAIAVSISGGTGFLRGEAYDDSKGLPLGQVTASLLSDGGGPLTAPVTVVADERGQFALAARAGDALVRITRPGYTAVDRRATVPVGSSTTVFDARLTPLDSQATLVSSAVGGQARDRSGRATLQIPPGGLAADQSITLTILSPQGLGALLPAGWSPIAAVAIEPATTSFGFPIPLTLPNATALPQNQVLTVARYDTSAREWVGAGTATVDSGGLTLRTAVERTGQFALLVPDAAPFAPAEPAAGAPLTGVNRPANQTTGVTAVGDVVPRSAPPGDEARALGRVGVTTPAPAPSGTFIQARVSERFDLLDQTQVLTQPFTQDLVSYATPRPGPGGTLGAAFPITPSRNFSIQELMLGVVRLDVTPFASDDGAAVVGGGGGTVTNTDGDTLQVPAGALPGDVPIALRRVTAADAGITVPAGFDLVSTLSIDMVGVTFATAVQLSTAAVGGVTNQDLVLVARVFSDPFGQRRLEIVAVGELTGGRLVSHTTFGTLSLPGVRSGGEFVYLRAQQAVGFVAGTVSRGGAGPLAGVLITSDSVGVADVTDSAGQYLVAARAGVDTTVRALDPVSRDSASAVVRLESAGQVLNANLALAVIGPTVVAVNPAAGAVGVALDTSVTIDFSEALDATSVTPATVALQLAGSPVAAERFLSADGRRIVVRPSSPLAALSTYTVQLTAGLRDLSANPLTGYTPVTFTTLDPSRPTGPAPGRIVAELPDESGFVLITGAAGVAAGGAAVTVVNVRTQETASVLALADGSFRLRISALVGDELMLVLRGADGRETTIAITQFVGADGSITVGAAGGSIPGPADRMGTILPRALAKPGTFRIEPEDASTLPVLPGGFSYADSFALAVAEASFKALASLMLSESQNRFTPASAYAAPFTASGALTTPPDALVNSSLRFTAVVQDTDGGRRTVAASTAIVASTPNGAGITTSHASDFPTIFVTAPGEALPAQQVGVSAVAPAARVEFESPLPPGVQPTDTLLLAQQVTTADGPRLAVVDRLTIMTPAGGTARIRTTGYIFPGMTTAGHYAVVSTHDALVFVTGIVSGAEATAMVDGLPFVFTTSGANGRFIVPVRANAAFTLRFVDGTGAVRGTATGQAPGSGTTDIGDPLGATAGLFTVSGDPNDRSVVDINAPLVLRFSEPVDAATVPAAVVVTDDAGSRVFGRIAVDANGASATFTPQRRWRFGTQYRYGVATSVLAQSGARLRAPFSSSFTTFQPSVVGTLPIAGARDVAVAGATAVVATDAGITTVDVASPRAPRVLGQAAIPGGANGVTILSAPVIDRNGQSHASPLALVAAGSVSVAGTVRSFDLTTPAAPAALGSTQLTNAPGQSPPANVPAFVGTPQAVATSADGLAFVAIEGVGASSVQIGQAIPLDTTVPARGAGARYPAGAESANDVARLGNRLLVAGVAGLTVLDATTMQRLGGVNTTGNAQGVAALEAFRMDVNGDGVIAPTTEVFDLAVVANGLDGTLQFYRVPETGDPLLLSAVRFAGAETSDVQVDGTERLAYVALGARGLAIVDLDGPASVQPIDGDRNGVDDRVLGVVLASGDIQRAKLDLRRGLGFVAAQTAGVQVLQLLPPRTRLLTLERDPIAMAVGDEESIAESLRAFTTDDGLRLTIDAIGASDDGVSLLAAGGAAAAFTNGSLVQALTEGLNDITLRIESQDINGSSDITLSTRTTAGQVLHSVSVHIGPPDSAAEVRALQILPNPAVLAANAATLPIKVLGVRTDGRSINVTRPETGTTYEVLDKRIATVDASGLATAVAGGTTEVQATHGRLTATGLLTIGREPSLTGLEGRERFTAFSTLAERRPVEVIARFSDGSEHSAASVAGTTFESSNPGVISVDTSGVLTPLANGAATITVRNGAFAVDVQAAVELRQPAALTGIDLLPIASGATVDEGEIQVQARLTGTGSLAGLSVTFAASGGATVTVASLTSYEGVALAVIPGLTTPTELTITASVVNPATGQTLSDAESFSMRPGTADTEPNSTDANASRLADGRTAEGTLNGTTDSTDVFRSVNTSAGTLTITFSLTNGADAAGVSIVVRNASGVEIARFTPIRATSTFSVQAADGETFVSVEGTAQVAYRISTRFEQRELSIASLSPGSGGPGTVVTIDGEGFSTDHASTRVLFGAVVGRLISASATRIQVQVPANAVDGIVQIISGDRRVNGPQFTTGSSASTAPTLVPSQLSNVRLDPVTRSVIDVTRLHVFFDPLVTRAQVEARATQAGATIVGVNPVLNAYMFEFDGNQTIAGLEALRRTLGTDAQVRFVARQTALSPRAHQIDARDWAGNWAGRSIPRGTAYANIGLFDAIETIQSTPPFDVTPAPFHQARTAILDSGFDPRALFDYQPGGSGPAHPRLFRWDLTGSYTLSAYNDVISSGHGTAVTSVIAAGNEGLGMSGVLHGVLKPNEQPFPVHIFAVHDSARNIAWDVGGVNAFTEIARLNASGVEFDAANISWGRTYATDSAEYRSAQRPFREALALLAGRTIVTVASGNDGVDTRFDVPSGLAVEMAHVLSVGGTATSNFDATGEGPSHRADFGTPSDPPPATPCSAPYRLGSACGPSITIAAPAEDVLMAEHNLSATGGNYKPWTRSRGTSFAAPIVAGIVGLLQAIRDTESPIPPSRMRQLLLDTADDISRTWTPFTMKRVNVLAAVRTLLRVPPDNQHIYVADNNVPVSPTRSGKIIGLKVDPTTGLRNSPTFDIEIDLGFTRPGTPPAVFLGTAPTGLLVSHTADRLYAIVTSVTPQIGDGVLVINTISNAAVNFIPLSGDSLEPSAGSGLYSPVTMPTPRPAMVLSKDGTLLYVAVGRRIVIVNTVTESVVQTLADLPAPYNALAHTQGPNALQSRMAQLDTDVFLTPFARPGTLISGLTLSPDGRTLYAAVQSGTGGGQQQGGALPIDVDLYVDTEPDAPGLQTNLASYLTARTPRMRMQAAAGGRPTSQGDEPSAISVSADGKHVYLLNGGMDSFTAVSGTDLDLSKFYMLVGGPIMALGVGGGSGLLGAMISLASFEQLAPQLYEELRRDLRDIASGGVTLLAAPGFTGTFSASPDAPDFGQQQFLFPSDVVFGWNPNPANGGLVVNQFRFPGVFAKRPFGMSFHRNGRRALVPYFQTGNFGVLDLDFQASLTSPALTGLPGTMFNATVAVTPAIALDNHLWPSRGAFRSGGIAVQSPDEALLYPTQVEYAQNGKFAVASHTGGPKPYSITAPLPDWQSNDGALAAMLQLGFTNFSGASAQDPHGAPVAVGQPYTFERGGGAISVIDNALIAADLAAHLPAAPGPRPYFSSNPIRSDAVRHILGYQTATGTTRFYEPRGVAVGPFVALTGPRHGDLVNFGTAIQAHWRDSRVTDYQVHAEDLTGRQLALVSGSLTPAQRSARSLSMSLGDLFASFPPAPVPGDQLRIFVTVYTSPAVADELSAASVIVTVDR